MKREQFPLYAIALAVLIVGLAFAGVPLGSLLILPLILVCPLMMFFMMRGMDHGGGTSHDHEQPSGTRDEHQDHHDHHDTTGR